MKVLVLENVGHLDYEIKSYLNKEHSKDKVEIIYSLLLKDEETQKLLLDKLKWCNIIVLQSTFYDRKQLLEFTKLLPTFSNIKEVRIIFTYNNPADNHQFINMLNNNINKDTYLSIIKMMETIKIKEILCKTVVIEKQEYFDNTDLYYDIVPLYYNKKYDLIFHERHPILDKTLLKYYLQEEKSTDIVYSINKKDIKDLKELLLESQATFEYQIDSAKFTDFGESNTIIKERNKWLNILNKYFLT